MMRAGIRLLVARLVSLSLVFMLALTLVGATNAHAQSAAVLATAADDSKDQGVAVEAPTPADLRELSRLLGNERIAAWLRDQAAKSGVEMESNDDAMPVREQVQRRLSEIRLRGRQIVTAMGQLPSIHQQLGDAFMREFSASELVRNIIYVLIFLFVGAGAEWLFWRTVAAPLATIEFAQTQSLGHAMRRAVMRGGLSLAAVGIFAIGCVGTFVSFDWPDKIQALVLNILIAAVVLRAVVAFGRFVFAPKVKALRLVPLGRNAASNAFFWLLGIAAVATAMNLLVDIFHSTGTMGLTSVAVETVAQAVTGAVVIAAIWYWKPATSSSAASILLTVLVLVVCVLGMLGASAVNWTLIVLGLLGPIVYAGRGVVNYFFDRAIAENVGMVVDDNVGQFELLHADELAEGSYTTDDSLALAAEPVAVGTQDEESVEAIEDPAEDHPLENYRPVIQRLVRFVLVVTSVLVVAYIWKVPLWNVSSQSSMGSRLVAAAVDITVAVLIADLIWSWARTVIDRRLNAYEAPEHGSAPGPEARMATLLPLLRKGLRILVIVMVVLIALSSLGVNIGPLIAGAGVVGIAIGFGAQALVKDIVSGIFFLVDDAFRVGEYIEMGDLRGTVESMSIRSLRLRHHRGAVHTIPFGELTSLTNHSRDWAIIKLEFRVPFDTDLKLVKKLVKGIAKELQANEDYGHHLIEPLKFQGVRRMEEFNMVVGVKFMSRPGEQWTIRRDAYQKVRDAFDANGVVFAERQVRVEVVGADPADPNVRKAASAAAEQAAEGPLGPPAAIPDEP